MHTLKRRQLDAGFTLIEILVTISIIALLVSIAVIAMGAMNNQASIERTRSALQVLQNIETELRIQRGNRLLPGKQETPVSLTQPTDPDDTIKALGQQSNASDFTTTMRCFAWAALQFEVTGQMLDSVGGSLLVRKKSATDPANSGSWTEGQVVTVRDSWDTEIAYFDSADGKEQFKGNPRPFFVSAGPDKSFGDINGSDADKALAEDNLYSTDQD